jgi:lipoprotein-anchoring transpeptidase ErfK/SrfK
VKKVLPPDGVGTNERWIDIDLSRQRLTVYKGANIVDSFLVSTGLWGTPTVTGTFHIYAKLNSQTMSGPGYYLPDVPYVMYFYEDYSIHGTYWHNNFGTPMSHGCVNMRTSDAKWLYGFAKIGTVVNIHY